MSRMLSRIRLLPITLVVAALVLFGKVGAVWHDLQLVADSVTLSKAEAQMPAASANAAEPKPAAPAAAPTPAPAVPPSAMQGNGGTLPGDALPYSQTEIELLQKLGERREAIEKRERELEMREGLVKAAEVQLGARSAELTELQSQLKLLVKQRDSAEDNRLAGLVSIYEKMKPKEAAEIMNGLDLDVLVGVLRKMKDAKTAPILASMEPERAREVTARLAQQGVVKPAGG